ncbi:MAG: O-methyltransferase [Candidatus Zixiibacteriota bacterium]
MSPRKMELTPPQIMEYITKVSPHDDRNLQAMEKYARKNDFPIIGPVVGRFLSQMARLMGATQIFEMGSGYGYSAYWFATGMRPGGRIICTDGSEENRTKAEKNFAAGQFDIRLEYHVGDAIEILEKFKGPFDIILNDIDKEDYPRTIPLAAERLRNGGLFITDNTLWSGRILSKSPDKPTKAILKFNKMLMASKEFHPAILPIRDGLGFAIKI